MNEQDNHLLSEIYKLTEENNKYLRKIDRRQRYSMYWRIFMFMIAVGSALGIYYFLQPYFENIRDIYDQAQTTFSSFTSFLPQGAKK